MLFSQIKLDRMKHLGKDSVAFSILGLVISEIQRSTMDHNVPDEKVIKVIKKLIESIDASLSDAKKFGADESKVLTLQKEHTVLSGYLANEPAQLTEEELKTILIEVLNEHPEWKKQLGALFGFMKTNYANRYDGAVVKKLLADL